MRNLSIMNKEWVEFAQPDQLERYKRFEQSKEIPVFVAIGIGGKASKPEHLYILPLKRIKSTFLHIDFLQKFEKIIDRDFYFDQKNEVLR